MHGYQRTWPLGLNGTVTQKNYANPSTPVYIVNVSVGGAGLPSTKIVLKPR